MITDENSLLNGKRHLTSPNYTVKKRSKSAIEESPVPITKYLPAVKKTITDHCLNETILSKILTAMETLITENKQLKEEVGAIRTEIKEVKLQLKHVPVSTKKSFAEIVSKSLTSPSTQVSIIRAAKLAQSCDARKSFVIVRNSEISPDATQDQILGEKIAKECGVSGKVSVFRIPVKDKDPLIKIQLENKEEASKMLSTFEANKCKINECR
uniref:Uncharacterized protein n=1 Tax=Caenorhabditis japonica TaxID=281687 RepID=A0A8R1I086_CAEJA